MMRHHNQVLYLNLQSVHYPILKLECTNHFTAPNLMYTYSRYRKLASFKCSAKIVKRIITQSTCSIHLRSELNNSLIQCIPSSMFKLLQDAARDEDTRSVRNKKEICPILALR